MQVKNIYIVTRPKPCSIVADILIEADAKRLELQFRGGLTAEEIFGIYTDLHEAAGVAWGLIVARDNDRAEAGVN